MHTVGLRFRRLLGTVASALVLVACTLAAVSPLVTAGPRLGVADSALRREPQVTPAQLADGLLDGVQYADPTAGLVSVEEPVAGADGGAHMSYPLVVPKGRGLTPDLQLSYDSAATSSFVGYGWNLSVGEITVDTSFGVPLFCPREQEPVCANVESETYRLDGELLAPTAVRTDLQPRVAERADFTRKVETEYEHIIRRGDSPNRDDGDGRKYYSWEVHDKSGGVRWYGGFPDAGGPDGLPGTWDGAARNDLAPAPDAILFDDNNNAFTWYLKAERDSGMNLVRYEYKTVYYKAETGPTGGTTWTRWQPPGPDAPCPTVCGHHVYLSKIFYSGAAQASGQPESPAYEVKLSYEHSRRDPVISARGGFLDVDLKLLTKVKVSFHDPRTGTDHEVVKYELEHGAPGPFDKTLLRAVHQVGCDTGCDESTRATHKFAYFNPLKDDNFGEAVPVATGDDGLSETDNLTGIDPRASALGMSRTDGGDGHVYIGFNPGTIPAKADSFGGALTFDGSSTQTQVELLDINGDNLPDKVWADSDGIHYRLNRSLPGGPLTFDNDPGEVSLPEDRKIDSLGSQSTFGITGGVEAYFKVAAMFHAGGSWNWSNRYFADVNADGLPDLVDGHAVLYNSLDCTAVGKPCKPTFSTSDGATRAPLDVQDVGHTRDQSERDLLDVLRPLSPPIDNVRRWRAPFDGRVDVDFDAVVAAPPTDPPTPPAPPVPADCDGTGGARLAVQLGDHELAEPPDDPGGSCTVSPGEHWQSPDAVFHDIQVDAGQFLYFRVGPDLDRPGTDVTWNPTVTYQEIRGDAVASGIDDANGLDQRTYDATAEFTVAGRPNSWVTAPATGLLSFDGVLDKQPTTDYVRPTAELAVGDDEVGSTEPVTVTPVGPDATDRVRTVEERTQNGHTSYCVVTPRTTLGCFGKRETADDHAAHVLFPQESGSFRVTSQFDVSGPRASDDGTKTATDRVRYYLRVDSPIGPKALHWSTVPQLCYLQGAAGSPCRADSEFPPPVDTDIYPAHLFDRPQSAYVATDADDDETRTLRATFELDKPDQGGHPVGDVVLTVKGSDGSRLAKATTTVRKDQWESDNDNPFRVETDVELHEGVSYFFDVTVREPGLFTFLRNAKVELENPDGDPGFTDVTDPYAQFHGTGFQGYLPLDHRGWAVVGYRGDGPRRTSPITESELELEQSGYDDKHDACKDLFDGGDCPENNAGHVKIPANEPGVPELDTAALKDQFKKAYAFTPVLQTVENGSGTDDDTVRELWQGPQDSMQVTATALSASRLGRPLPAPSSGSGGLIRPPTIRGRSAPSLSLTFGPPGPFAASLAVGWGDGDSEYLDMNGDRYPDIVTDNHIQYTDPRGGHACVTSVTPRQYAVCEGDGPNTVSSDFSVSVNAGISGSPSKPKTDAHGQGNSTAGSQSGQGQPSQTDEYGAKIGAGLSFDGSWTAPLATDTSSFLPDDHAEGHKLSELPGSGPGDSGLLLQRQLADLNGDSLPDQVQVKTDGIHVAFNTGYGFTLPVKWTGPRGFESGESYSGSLSPNITGFAGYFKDYSGGFSRTIGTTFPRYAWADVNGDGILDALHKNGGGSDVEHPGSIDVAFGSGSGLGAVDTYGTHGSVPIPIVPELGDEVGINPGQQVGQQSTVTHGIGADFTIAIGPLCVPVAACYLIINPGGHFQDTLATTDVSLMDVNGDGYADSVTRKQVDVKDPEDSEELTVRLNEQGRTNLLQHVENPLHGTVDVDYEREGNTVDHPDSLWVMSSVQVDDARHGTGCSETSKPNCDGVSVTRTAYQYGTPRYDFVNRERLGFDEVVAREATPGGPPRRTTRTTYANRNIWQSGLEQEVEVHRDDVDGPLLERTTNTWEVRDGDTQERLPANLTADQTLTTWATPLLANERFESFEPDSAGVRATETTYKYDRLGNQTDVVDRGDLDDPGDDVTTELTWSNCDNAASNAMRTARCGARADPNGVPQPAFWSENLCPTWVSVPATVKVLDAHGQVLRYRDGSTDLCELGSVTLLRELVSGGIDGGQYADTRLGYDAWGNYNRVVYPLAENGRHYAVHYRYDPARRSDVGRVTEYELAPADLDAFLAVDDTVAADQFDPPLSGASKVGLTSSATFDGPTGQVASRTDANGQTTTYRYDALGRPAEVTLADGGRVLYDYDPGNAAYARASARNSDQFHPGEFIETVSFADGLGRITQQKQEVDVFAAFDQPARHGFAVTGAQDYDALGRVTREAQPTFASYATALNFVPKDLHTFGAERTWDARDRLISETLPGDRTTTTEYGIETRLLPTKLLRETTTDPLQRKTVTYTDMRDYVRIVDDVAVDAPRERTTYTYDPMGQLLTVHAAGRDQLRNTWDLLGQRTSTRTEDGGTTAYQYDPMGQQVSVQTENQRAVGDSRTAHHYEFGHLVGADNPDQTPDISYVWGGYDGQPTTGNTAGRVSSLVDAARRQSFRYDSLGRVTTESTEMVGADWKQGRLSTSVTQDWLGRPAALTYPDGEVLTHRYDRGGRLEKITGAKPCNVVGTLTSAIDATQTVVSVTELPHESAPPLPFVIKVDGEQIRVTARTASSAPDGWLYTVERGINGTPAAPTASAHAAGADVTTDAPLLCAYRYLDRAEYDVFGAPAFRQIGNGNRTEWVRDPETRRLARQVTTSPAQPQASAGKLTAAVTASATELHAAEVNVPPVVPFLATIGAEKVRVVDRVPAAAPGEAVWIVQRGAAGTTPAPAAAGAAVLVDRIQQNLAYTYDNADNILSYDNDLPPDVPSLFGGKVRQNYDYDGHYRLTSANGTWQDALNTRSFEHVVDYDATTGNATARHQRVWEEKVGCKKNCVDPVTDLTYDFTGTTFQPEHQHQLLTQGDATYSHDRDGNVTAVTSPAGLREMTWDAQDKLTMVVDRPNGNGGKPTYYTYDHNGELAKEDKEQGRTWFVNPWVTVKNGTTWKNVFADGERLATKFSEGGYEQKVYFRHEDQLGSTNITTDRSGRIFQHQEYLPSGEAWVDEDSTVFRTPYQFSGEYTDEDHNLVDFGQRWYDPRNGLFLSTDPLLEGNPDVLVDEPMYQSTYTLSHGNAVTYVDPDGLAKTKTTTKTNASNQVPARPLKRQAKKSRRPATKLPLIIKALPVDSDGDYVPGGYVLPPGNGPIKGTNAKRQLTSRTGFRPETIQRAYDNAPKVNGQKVCPVCLKTVMDAPGTKAPGAATRNWDGSHSPSWTKRRFPRRSTRAEVITNYNTDVFAECISCNRTRGNRDKALKNIPKLYKGPGT